MFILICILRKLNPFSGFGEFVKCLELKLGAGQIFFRGFVQPDWLIVCSELDGAELATRVTSTRNILQKNGCLLAANLLRRLIPPTASFGARVIFFLLRVGYFLRQKFLYAGNFLYDKKFFTPKKYFFTPKI